MKRDGLGQKQIEGDAWVERDFSKNILHGQMWGRWCLFSVRIWVLGASQVRDGECKEKGNKKDVLFLLSSLTVYSDSYSQIASANKLRPC